MARPLKRGIDYFSHDVNMNHDIKIKLLKAKFGITGYAIYNLLLEDIYKNGYYLEINEDYMLIFCSENIIESDLFQSVLDFMISRELFSKSIYESHGVLTSKRIQENYLEATKKRKCNNAILDKFCINSEITNVNSEIIIVNDDINTQSKVKQNKVKQSKVNKTKEENNTVFDNFWNLYDKKIGDKKKLITKFNKLSEEDVNKIFETLPDYIKATPDKKFRKNPETYLNNHSWNDEIIIVGSKLKPDRRNNIQEFKPINQI